MTPTVSMNDAPGHIRQAVGARPFAVVAISGAVGSGKSTLAARLSTCVLSTDDYLPDYDAIPEHERDEPRHADFARLVQDLALLRQGLPARSPVWSFRSHARAGYRDVTPAPIIVLEGIHALHDPVLESITLGVFIEAPGEVRWRRWEYLESTGQRGWGVEKAREFFHAVAEPTFERYAPRYRARARLIVQNPDGPSPC